MQFARGGLQFRIKSDYTRRPQNASFARQYARKMCAPSFGLVGRTSKSGTRSLRVFCQSKLAMCELIYFAVVSCLWGERAGKRGNGAKRSALAHGKLTDALVTEEQHPGWAQPKGFRWFSGPEDVLRVVLRVVLCSETWALDPAPARKGVWQSAPLHSV